MANDQIAPAQGKIVVSGFRHFFDTADGPVQATGVVDLAIRAGEFVTLVGPSGCGKTTLLKAIAGFIKPTEGAIFCDGREVTRPGRDRGVVFQELAILPWRTVRRNIGHGLEIARVARAARERAVARLIELTGLVGFEDRYPHELSGGMKQRVALARALAPNPQVLLMDEPFAALDAMTREQLYDDLQAIQQKRRKTVVFVTHNVREAVSLGDRVLLFTPSPGRIRRGFSVDLARPRDINDIRVTQLAAEITHELKNLLQSSGA
jgi:sulfonate transport system ATP-binding protein